MREQRVVWDFFGSEYAVYSNIISTILGSVMGCGVFQGEARYNAGLISRLEWWVRP